MAQNFAKTWWGEQWLQSLSNIDFSNRLPRGSAYAKKGAVKNIVINNNKITAKVSGSRRTPYQICIVIPQFSQRETKALLDKIIEYPSIISRLLNNELDEEILKIANQLSLKVFPQTWRDFYMDCSCPDWAVPCKHLAAVIYMMAREIDNNPFLIFQLHGVDFQKELEMRHISLPPQNETIIPTFEETISFLNDETLPPFKDENAYRIVDVSTLNNITNTLCRLLPDNPPFDNKSNFAVVYSNAIQHNAKIADKWLTNPDKFLEEPDSYLRYFIDKHTNLSFSIDKDRALYHSLGKECSFLSIMSGLWKLSPDFIANYTPSVSALYRLLILSVHLIKNGAVVPQLLRMHDNSYSIRWIPAMLDEKTRTLVRKTEAMVPPCTIVYKKVERKKSNLLQVKNQAFEILSVFITTIIRKTSKDNSDNRFYRFFFLGEDSGFNKVGEKAIPGGLKVWLDRFFMADSQFRQVLMVSETAKDCFSVDISIEDTTQQNAVAIPLATVFTSDKYQDNRFKILQSTSLLNSFVDGLSNYLNQKAQTPISYNALSFAPFLLNIIPVVQMLGVKVVLPKSLQRILRPKPTVKIKAKENMGFFSLSDFFDFEWKVAIGDNILTPAEFHQLVKTAGGLLKFKENYFYVDEADLARLEKQLSAKDFTQSQLLQIALSEDFDDAPVELTAQLKEVIASLAQTEKIALPEHLHATLRPYQENGFAWMYRNTKIGFGSIIADDMGLGKTLQVITLLLKFQEEKNLDFKHRALIVVPTALLINWQLEIERFAPSLQSFIYHGTSRCLKEVEADIILTTYGVVRSDVDILKKIKWRAVIIDEAQNIKNQDTAQSKSVKSIPASVKIAMSGTPVENRLSEFLSIMDFVNKGFLGNIKTFKNDFSIPIQMYNDAAAIQRFRKITAPFMLRRLKTDKTIISDLPDKIEQNEYGILTASQAALYEKTVQEAMKLIEGVTETDHQSLFKREALVLQMILALKQICNHPTQYLKDGRNDPSLSGKTEMLLELLETILDRNEKVLIFTQFKEMGQLLQQFISEKFDETPMFYHGGCSVKQRQEMVDRFQNSRNDRIFLLSLKAAGTGLNLTAASHVIHYDLWWNPAVEAQATDRAYRIGQNKNVQVHRFITQNTFEEKIDSIIQNKKNLADLTVAVGESWIGKLNNQELRDVFER